ncbi:pimeloyl-ACP methyl ester carboxylesterase [Peteryoungia aggregata LMG 23059]|uniref:Pimeloyl-ACP methyl ester carboxylesterase n=1 Tax=Peteryoungia aggregata LMG 23059 TaxID=1368425 RepID=A0ABU0G7Z9_9HYPH|nr:alpha/beta hydrolase [Peteryoungia aggregata]MDQ0421423.1 pimeloyl-ACP methyl ester carboxylesterase [Peteryoungia aggregata LMG 23059]
MPSFPLKVTRLAFAQLEKVSPVLAGRLAFELFCRTPSRRPKGAKAKQVFLMGRNRLRQAVTVRLALARGMAAAHQWPNESLSGDSARILVVHGWGSRAEYLTELAFGLRQAGAEVVVLDLPGHGASTGRRLDLKIAAEAIVAAERHFGRFDGVVGHSFGGAAVMMAAGRVFEDLPPLQAGRIALIGSPSSMGEVFSGFAGMVGLGRSAVAAMRGRAMELVGARVEDLDGVGVARRIDLPLLVVHAEDDKEVNVGHAQRYIGVSPHVRHLWANGHGHRRIVNAPEVIQAVASFLMGAEASLPSGARAAS